MNKPLVSILMPCYNVSEYLADCLDTVIGQTYENLQIVLIDDGSKDDTLKIAEEYAARDKRVEVYTQKNQGVASTRNNLLDKVKGEYVLFIDSDDWVELDMVEHLVSLAVEHNVGMVMCDRVINDAPLSEKPIEIKTLEQKDAVRDFLYHGYFVGSLCNKLIKTPLIDGVKFHPKISYGEDALFIWGVLQNLDKMVVTSKQLYHYRMNDLSISHQGFGEKKLTGHQTWTLITEDVMKRWPEFKDIVLGTFALEDMYLLQAASQSGYPYNSKIKDLQQNVRLKLHLIRKRNITIKTTIYAHVIAYWYGYGRVYYALNKLKARII